MQQNHTQLKCALKTIANKILTIYKETKKKSKNTKTRRAYEKLNFKIKFDI